MIDLFQSRRGYNEKCKWWSRNENDQYDESELIMKRAATGIFWAKEINPENLQNAIIGGTFMFDKTTVTIESRDNLMGIKNNDMVLFREEMWRVKTVQKKQSRNQQSEYMKQNNCSHIWYVELRR